MKSQPLCMLSAGFGTPPPPHWLKLCTRSDVTAWGSCGACDSWARSSTARRSSFWTRQSNFIWRRKKRKHICMSGSGPMHSPHGSGARQVLSMGHCHRFINARGHVRVCLEVCGSQGLEVLGPPPFYLYNRTIQP